MKNSSTAAAMIALLGAMACALPHAADAGASSPVFIRNLEPFEDPSGAIATYNANGRIDTRGAFFQSLGTNGRSCASCHAVDQAMSIAPPQLRGRFKATHGRDPVFAAVDGANCPNAAVGDPAGHSLLLNYGLIRIPQPIPATAQFTLSVVHDPYGCALVVDPATGLLTASVYRRPLPTTNLRFLSAIMFDGRETVQPLTSVLTFDANLNADLTHQAQTAVTVHFQANHTPTPAQLADIVNFELGLSTAQIWDRTAGPLDRAGADGGPVNLADQVYYPGLNDVLGADPTGAPFDMNGMSMFSAWLATASVGAADFRNAPPAFDDRPASEPLEHAAARSDIAAGETLFNTLPITISGVRGLNDNAALGKPSSFIGHCTTCHDTPNVGDHSLPLPLDIGLGHTVQPGLENDPAIAAALSQLDAPNLPVFLVSGCPTPFSAGQPVSFYTTDPGKGLITGQCSDLNRVKGPILRGLAARAPYFHNGAAASLLQAVNFYNQRFNMNLTDDQKRQLVVFLNSL